MAIENNQKVAVRYELKVEGNLVDSNLNGEPLEFAFGAGQIIPGLESRIQDMSEGESKDISVPAEEGYGEYNEQAQQTLPKEQFQAIEDLQIGMPLQAQGQNGQPMQVMVKDIMDDSVVIDLNHPLAGKELNFSITVDSIN
jgi:FKBP-type peptidyl-prolyl cis-trans isomerase SlyD